MQVSSQALSAYQTPLQQVQKQDTSSAVPKLEQQNEQLREKEVNRDDQRATAVDLIARQSKKTQAEIYLSVTAESQVTSDNTTANTIEALRDVQKQNNIVKAYATYQEHQA